MYSPDDWLLTQLFLWKKFDAKSKLKVTRKVVKPTLKNENNKKVILFFPYWTGKSSFYNWLARKFPDYTLVFYDYPNEMMSRKINVSLKYMRDVLKDAFNVVLDFRRKGYTEVTLVGSSLGSNISLKLASMIKVDKIVLNMIDRTLALEILTSPPMGILRKKLQKTGMNLQVLEQIYRFMSTEENLPLVSKTKAKLLIFSSRNDIFCTPEQIKPIIKELDSLGIDYELKTNWFLGHILSLYKNIFFRSRIVKFIKEK